jgi:hypothetical protein
MIGSAANGQTIGVTGHQTLEAQTKQLVREQIRLSLSGSGKDIVGITSLAAGADQIFAETVLEVGGRIHAILPCKQIERSFDKAEDLTRYRALLAVASEVVTMPFDEPSEEAYWSAGREIVDRAQRVIAVWDGKPAAGLGGTADVVDYARSVGKHVEIIWPQGARRK